MKATYKLCYACATTKESSQFYNSARDGLQNKCKECCKIYYNSNRDNYRRLYKIRAETVNEKTRLRAKQVGIYGLTLKDYEDMVLAQESKCAVCLRHQSNFKKVLAVDHCHKTGQVRALLCCACNQFLGHYEKHLDSGLLDVFGDYIKKFRLKKVG